MKILLATSIFPPDIGGPATYSFKLAQALSKKHQVTVVAFSKQTDDSLPYKVVSVAPKGSSLSRQWRLFKAVWKSIKDSEVVYCQDPLVVGLVSLVAAMLANKPLVVKFVGDIVWETARNQEKTNDNLEDFYIQTSKLNLKREIEVVFQRWVLNKAQTIVVPSQYLKAFLIKFHQVKNPSKIIVIYNGVEPSPKKQGKRKELLAVTIGRLVSWKRIDKIFQAIKSFPKLEYWVIGKGPEKKKLKELIDKLKLGNRVRLLGALPNHKVKEILNKSSIFILNSSYEGLPHVLLEAAMAGNAIIAPALPGIKEIFSSQEAELFQSQNQEELKKAISRVLKDQNRVRFLANRAYLKVNKKFLWENTFQEIEKLLVKVIKEEGK